MASKLDLTILQGKTFSQIVRWETEPIIYKAISGITTAAPAVITCTGHSVPNNWRVAIVSVKGMTQINAENDPPKDSDYHQATVLNANTIELNDVNAAGFKAYTSGGYVQYNTPHDLTGYEARMTIRDKIGGTALDTLTDVNGKLVISTTDHYVKILIDATTTALYTWTSGVYDLEVESPTGEVTQLLYGKVKVTKEVTT